MRILLITNFFPPTNIIASFRMYSFATYLPDFGVKVDVLTPRRSGSLSLDLSNIDVHYPLELPVSFQFATRRNVVKQVLKHTGIRAFRHYATSAFYHSSLQYASKLDKNRYSAILASYPLEDSLRIGYALSRRWDTPLIVDYRDLWLQNGYADWTPMDALFIRILEGRINRHASLVIASTRGATEKLQKRFGKKVATIYNGFWDEEPRGKQNRDAAMQKDRITFCYCGSLYGGKRPLEWLFPLLAQDKKYHLKVAVLEEIDANVVKRYAEASGVKQQVELYVGLTSAEADRLEVDSDVLILLNLPHARGNDVIPAKFYRHLLKGRFIMGLGHKNDEVGAILRELNAGIYLSHRDDINLFFGAYDGWNIDKRRDIGFYSRKAQAGRLAAEMMSLKY
ncbi:glycosyltransferase [candidate division KSB1 bacterium]|nr:glycosyltransferase [candidate division KSB1 bacterium]